LKQLEWFVDNERLYVPYIDLGQDVKRARKLAYKALYNLFCGLTDFTDLYDKDIGAQTGELYVDKVVGIDRVDRSLLVDDLNMFCVEQHLVDV
jgi:hypothetical protein